MLAEDFLLKKILILINSVNGIEHGLQPLDTAVVHLVAALNFLIFGFLVHGKEAA
jgi:hypothetical protein